MAYGMHGSEFRVFSTLSPCTLVWKLQKFIITLFWQKFRESNGFTNIIELLTELSCKNGFYQERGPKDPDF